ncbi:MAG TPA: ImmA/IrrE family metallo-endopeptidase [Candidatus Babeliaceae bacterium]|nr:ImmA/IrrE family metallo-endopeptidase [Candidatus Babeliaceae bacterium]
MLLSLWKNKLASLFKRPVKESPHPCISLPQYMYEKYEAIKKHQIKAPVPVLAIAEELGLPVFDTFELDKETTGMLIKDKDNKYNSKSGYAIFVNASHPICRKRFTIAIEIAHYIRHKEAIRDGIAHDMTYNSYLSDRAASIAHSLAYDILMPWTLLNHYVNKGISAPKKMAKLFQVPVMFMANRLKLVYLYKKPSLSNSEESNDKSLS